ncbi:hypothetical protein EVAR_85226_1 [Eumeta japonica]|uniref:CCHC-type domain-containing protein n=1 Tax=Eumeta variegata TaxID=151549 RepID=A0A4C1W0I7_EUMVA|nr:hypothetical protein EVAR_85226_1 [Eumeta japonica]
MPRSTSRGRSRHRRNGSRVRDSSRSRDRHLRGRSRRRSYTRSTYRDRTPYYRRRYRYRSRRYPSTDRSSDRSVRRSRTVSRRSRHRTPRRYSRDDSARRIVRRPPSPHTPPLVVPQPTRENDVHCEGNNMQSIRVCADQTKRAIDSVGRYSEASTLAHAIIDAVKSVQPVRSHNYFVSFDPTINNIDDWCEEVDRAKNANGWSDHECLSRVANCLRGDAKTWICEWVTNDRTWSNFKLEFKPLCPVKLDFANILYDAMSNTSDKYTTYAEYARRALLRLRIVQGLSDELRTLIVIRSIDNTQIRAAAADAGLTTDNIVTFLSIYTKASRNRESRALPKVPPPAPKARHQPAPSNHVNINCFTCGQRGHRRRDCPKRPRLPTDSNANSNKPSYSNHRNDQCTFCKKPGHSEDKCFAKNRSELRNERSVNLCKEPSNYSQSNDITTAVVYGVPMDVLIDSGALNVSLVSTAVLEQSFVPT